MIQVFEMHFFQKYISNYSNLKEFLFQFAWIVTVHLTLLGLKTTLFILKIETLEFWWKEL